MLPIIYSRKQERAIHLQGSLKNQLKPYHGNVSNAKRKGETIEIVNDKMPKVQRR